MNEEESKLDGFIWAVIFILFAVVMFLLTSILLMIPVVNVFIADALFGGE